MAGYKLSFIRCFHLLELTYDDLIDFCKFKKKDPPKNDQVWYKETRRCKIAYEVLVDNRSREDAKKEIIDGTIEKLSNDRIEAILTVAEVQYGKLDKSEQPDYKRWYPDIEKWKPEIFSDNNPINLSEPYLPSKEDVEYAYRTLTQLGESIPIDAVLNQIEINAKNKSLSLKNNWRMITEKNIEIWSKKR